MKTLRKKTLVAILMLSLMFSNVWAMPVAARENVDSEMSYRVFFRTISEGQTYIMNFDKPFYNGIEVTNKKVKVKQKPKKLKIEGLKKGKTTIEGILYSKHQLEKIKVQINVTGKGQKFPEIEQEKNVEKTINLEVGETKTFSFEETWTLRMMKTSNKDISGIKKVASNKFQVEALSKGKALIKTRIRKGAFLIKQRIHVKIKTATPETSVTPKPMVTATPSASIEPTVTPVVTPEITVAPTPSVTPKATATPKVTSTPEVTVSPKSTATATPIVTSTPSSNYWYIPVVTVAPKPTVTPKPTVSPKPTATPKPTVTPKSTVSPKPTVTPEPTVTPKPTVSPKPTATPESTVTPEPTITLEPMVTPKPIVTLKPTETPEPTLEPVHTHEPAPDDLQYEYKESNDDGTHTLEGAYTCSCGETITLSKEEDCQYVETIKQNPSIHNLENIHIVQMDCEICGFHKEEEAPCVSNNVKFYFRYLSQIYEAETCTICEYRCHQTPHFEHVLGEEWKYYDNNVHRKECVCTEFRIEESHNYMYNEETGTLNCEGCGDSKETTPHEHGHGLAGKWGDKNIMMDVVMNSILTNDTRVSDDPIPNPQPSLDGYCYRFDLICWDCGFRYSAYVAHDFDENGVCQSSWCGHMTQN